MIRGKVGTYTKLLEEGRAEAMARGAKAILSMQFGTPSIMQKASEILCYGTAVIERKIEQNTNMC